MEKHTPMIESDVIWKGGVVAWSISEGWGTPITPTLSSGIPTKTPLSTLFNILNINSSTY
uniref:Uncharacterized protein n=1 Tax=Meloidogyne incognita TaxID=6306 RepID=A0A914NMW8_MELIC